MKVWDKESEVRSLKSIVSHLRLENTYLRRDITNHKAANLLLRKEIEEIKEELELAGMFHNPSYKA